MSDLFLKTTKSDGTDLRLQEVGASDPSSTSDVMWTLAGLINATTTKLSVRLDGAESEFTVETSQNASFSSPTTHGPFATQTGTNFDGESFYLAICELTGLSPASKHYARVVIDGDVKTDHIAEFTTLPVVGEPYSFSIGFASCNRGKFHTEAEPYSNDIVFEHISDREFFQFIHMGDWGYPDNGFDEIRDPGYNDGDHPRYWWQNYDGTLEQPRQRELFRKTPIVYSWDDHDFGPNNSFGFANDGTKRTYRDPAIEAYRTTIPHRLHLSDDDGAVFWSYIVGRVRCIKTDERSDAIYETGQRYSPAQVQWIKNEILSAKAQGQIVLWELSIPWIMSEDSPHGGSDADDAWTQTGFDDRDDLGAFIVAEEMSNSIVAIGGDMHAIAADDGRNNDWGGFPILQAAPLDRNNSTKGGPYQIGPFTESEHQWGELEVIDSGGETIAIEFTGYDRDTEISGASLSLTMEVPEEDIVTRTGTVTRDGSAVAGADVVFITRADLLANATAQTTTDASGEYSAEIPTGEEMVGIALEGADGDSTPFTEGA